MFGFGAPVGVFRFDTPQNPTLPMEVALPTPKAPINLLGSFLHILPRIRCLTPSSF